jgi:two-component system LytT family response regulator
LIEAVIVDDEPLARKRIRQLLSRAADFRIIAECRDGIEAVEVIERERPDVVFLDVQMPEMSGLEVAEAVGADRMPVTVFITAFDSYAIDAFDRHALDYLLKPVDDRRFADTLDRIRRAAEHHGAAESEPLQLLLNERRATGAGRILVSRDDRSMFLSFAEIDWIESVGNYVAIHAGDGKFLHRGTLQAFEARLDPGRFVRVHRGAIVQIDRIREIRDLLGRSRVVLRNGTELPVSRRCRQRQQRFAPG